eukprot:616826-Rhodomonas_salina.1
MQARDGESEGESSLAQLVQVFPSLWHSALSSPVICPSSLTSHLRVECEDEMRAVEEMEFLNGEEISEHPERLGCSGKKTAEHRTHSLRFNS